MTDQPETPTNVVLAAIESLDRQDKARAAGAAFNTERAPVGSAISQFERMRGEFARQRDALTEDIKSKERELRNVVSVLTILEKSIDQAGRM